jgi:hypothetical protein
MNADRILEETRARGLVVAGSPLRQLFNNISRISCCVAVLVFHCARTTSAGPIQDIDSIEKQTEELWGKITWGSATNEIFAGVSCEAKQAEPRSFQEVRILMRTKKTNGISSFFLPPDHKLAKAELRDTTGALIEPLPEKRIDSELAKQILIKDLPHYPRRPRHGPIPKNEVRLDTFIPEVFWDFSVQDVYRIEKEGDYTLRIVVGLYHMTSFDGNSVVRMDLPAVTVRLHLTPSPKP